MRAVPRLAVLAPGMLVALVLACGGPGRTPPGPAATTTPVLSMREIEVPGAPGAVAPSLAAAPDGRALLSWIEPREGGRHALRLATRLPRRPWWDPVTVAEGAGWFVNWADFSHVAALDDGMLVAHWMEKRPRAGSYDYDIRLTRSRDGGRTWDGPFAPYADLRVRRVDSSGSAGPSVLVARSSAARSSGFPRLARAGEETLVVWRDASEPPRLRAAVLEVGQ